LVSQARILRCLPIAAIEQPDFVRGRIEIEIVQATDIHGIRSGIRARIAKGMYAAVPAEEMLGDLLVELIESQFAFTLQQLKLLGGNIAA
jgi:hypothetical protein